MLKLRRQLALLCALALLLAACGSDGDAASGPTADAATSDSASGEVTTNGTATDFPVTIESDGGTWTLEAAPERIVSLSPTATEVLFAIGAGQQVVAVDNFSNYPDEAPVTDLSGLDPNVEAVVAFDPDLVVLSNDANDLVASLTALDIPVLISAAPADIDGGYATVTELGLATGQVNQTAEFIADLREEIDAAFESAPDATIRVYHELDDSFFSASSFGFVGSVYAEMGIVNIADEADADQNGFPQLTEEYIVAADPELIVITDQVDYTADDLADRPGWSEVAAVENSNIITVNADIASRWGPRLPLFIQAVADAVAAATVEA